jgi:hypothetical protein
MIQLTKTEKSINKLIHQIESNTNAFTPQREVEILYALQMISTLSQDNKLEILNDCIEKIFPEYGTRK